MNAHVAKFTSTKNVTSSEAMLCIKEAVGSTRLAIESELSMGLPSSPMHGARVRVIGGNFVTAKPVGVRDGIDFQRTGEIRPIPIPILLLHPLVVAT